MNFLYIDKTNSFSEIRIAERTIWGEEIPNFGHSVFYLLRGVNRKPLNTDGITNKNVFTVRFNKFYLYSTIIFINKMIGIILHQKIHFIVVRNSIDLALPVQIVSKILKRKFIYIKAYPAIETKILKFEDRCYFNAKVQFLNLLLRIDGLILNHSEYIISRTAKYSEYLKKKYGINREILSIPMGIQNKYYCDRPQINNINQEILKKNDCLIAIYFGTLDKTRKIEFIINVIYKVVSENKKIKCYIIGGRQENLIFIRNYAINKGVSDFFEFIPMIPRETLFKYIQIADFSISPIPPIEEYVLSSPTKVVESLALGCPVLGNYEIHDQKEIIEQSGGGYLLPYDENAFAKKILELYDNQEELPKLGLNGRKYVFENRTYTKFAINILNHLDLTY